MNYPIKRFKPDELRYNSNRLSYPKHDIYAGEQQAGVGESPSTSSQAFNATVEQEGWRTNDDTRAALTSNETESNEHNLFTNRLEPSLADITKIFDNSDDNSNDDHVSRPPTHNSMTNFAFQTFDTIKFPLSHSILARRQHTTWLE